MIWVRIWEFLFLGHGFLCHFSHFAEWKHGVRRVVPFVVCHVVPAVE